MTKVEIYQIRKDIDERLDILFMNYAFVTKKVDNLKVNLKSYYEKRYEYEDDFGNLNEHQILNELFYKFNMNRPEDFKGHSLSMSDIVILNDTNIYFCDEYGWQEVE